MGADQTVQILQEPLVDLFPKVKKPTFKLVEEHETFTEKVCHIVYLFKKKIIDADDDIRMLPRN